MRVDFSDTLNMFVKPTKNFWRDFEKKFQLKIRVLDSSSQKLKTNDHDSIHICIQKSKEIYLDPPYPHLR